MAQLLSWDDRVQGVGNSASYQSTSRPLAKAHTDEIHGDEICSMRLYFSSLMACTLRIHKVEAGGLR